MKKILALSLVLVGTLFFCACEKEMISPDLQQEDVSALKGAESKGMIQTVATPWPMPARIGGGAEYCIPATEEYGIITFYVYDPGVIPVEHNFYPMGYFVPEVWGLPPEAFSVEGTAWWLPDFPMSPHHYHVKGKGDVLFWIITFDQVLELYESGEITIPKIAACNPLVGYAKTYTENVRPYGGGAHVYGGVFTAKGTLEDGRRFIYDAHTKAFPDEPMKGIYHFEIFDK